MHAEVGAIMIGLSRLWLKTLIVACAIASVFAAASMKTALDAIAASWTAQSGTSPSIAYA